MITLEALKIISDGVVLYVPEPSHYYHWRSYTITIADCGQWGVNCRPVDCCTHRPACRSGAYYPIRGICRLPADLHSALSAHAAALTDPSGPYPDRLKRVEAAAAHARSTAAAHGMEPSSLSLS